MADATFGQEIEQPAFRGTSREMCLVGNAEAVSEVSRKIESLINRSGNLLTQPDTRFQISADHIQAVRLIPADMNATTGNPDLQAIGGWARQV